jgi:acetolactate synthase-1/2/3 large subunit
MGYSLPAAIGAKAAFPDRQVLALDGDGCFQMTCQELITASTENIPLKIVVFNNGNHGMVRQWQKIFYNSRFSASELTHHTPDYVKLAEAMGAVGLRMEQKSEVKDVFEKMLEINDKPVLVDCVVDPDDMVFPMVPAGGSNDVIILNEEDLKKI